MAEYKDAPTSPGAAQPEGVVDRTSLKRGLVGEDRPHVLPGIPAARGGGLTGPRPSTMLPENVQLSAPAKQASAAEPCPKFDPANCRCTYMNISAPATTNRAGDAICVRQTNQWMGRALPCKVPEIMKQPFSSEFVRDGKVRDQAAQVLNQIAREDHCPYVRDGDAGPICGPMTQACVKPEGHGKCRVFAALSMVNGVPRGPQQMNACQAAYDTELSEIEGRKVSHVTDTSRTRP